MEDQPIFPWILNRNMDKKWKISPFFRNSWDRDGIWWFSSTAGSSKKTRSTFSARFLGVWPTWASQILESWWWIRGKSTIHKKWWVSIVMLVTHTKTLLKIAQWSYFFKIPLVITICYWKWPIGIVDVPMNRMVVFHSYTYIGLPEGKYMVSGDWSYT